MYLWNIEHIWWDKFPTTTQQQILPSFSRKRMVRTVHTHQTLKTNSYLRTQWILRYVLTYLWRRKIFSLSHSFIVAERPFKIATSAHLATSSFDPRSCNGGRHEQTRLFAQQPILSPYHTDWSPQKKNLLFRLEKRKTPQSIVAANSKKKFFHLLDSQLLLASKNKVFADYYIII